METAPMILKSELSDGVRFSERNQILHLEIGLKRPRKEQTPIPFPHLLLHFVRGEFAIFCYLFRFVLFLDA